MSRFQEVARTVPPGTVGAMGLNAALFVVQIVGDVPLPRVTLCPERVLYRGEIYRIVTSAFFHGGLVHIAMNMVSLSAVGSLLERRLGTLRTMLTMLWSVLLTSLLHIFASWLVYAALGISGPFMGHSIGFSGVIFHLSVLECNLGTHQIRSVFNLFDVPAHFYPWVLLLVLQLVMPNLSFAGHLSGIVVGTLQLYGMLRWLMPKENKLKELEGRPWIRWLSSWPSFVAATSDDSVVSGNGASLRQGIGRAFLLLRTFLYNIAETIKVAIFGRGSRANSNIHLGLLTPEPHDVSEYTEEEDEDSWNGLPENTTGQIV